MGKWGYIGAYNYKPVLVYLVSTRGGYCFSEEGNGVEELELLERQE